jgi:hypothetical protein
MRLYNTDQGPAREDEPGILTVVDLSDLGDVVRDGGLRRQIDYSTSRFGRS